MSLHRLLASRLAEQGVSMVQLYHRGWDMHGGIATNLPKLCREVDQEQLTYRFQGRDFRLTDVHGRVVYELMA